MALVTYNGPSTGGIQQIGRHVFAAPVKPGDTVEVPAKIADALDDHPHWTIATKPKTTKKAAKPATEEQS